MSAWQPRLMRKLGSARDDGSVVREEDGQREAPLQTWMEVYRLPEGAPSASDVVQAAIDRWARAAGILELIDGERHYEIFETCA